MMTTPQRTADAAMTDPTTSRLTAGSADIVAFAWPTNRPVYAYTPEEIAEGVDLYTQAMKARARGTRAAGGDDASE